MIRSTLSLATVLSVAAGLALADSHEATETEGAAAGDAGMEDTDHGGAGMDHGDMAMPEADPGMTRFMAVMETMMSQMPMESTGDVDADFLLLMIPHHQSAVDMARLVVGAGDDPEVKAMAEKIIEDQEAEIATMKEMLAAMGVEMPGMAEEAGMESDEAMEAEDGMEAEGETEAEGEMEEEPASE